MSESDVATADRSCTKCTVEGDYIENRICFPRFGAPRRTDEDFRNKTDESYHKGGITCNLLEIPNFGPVTNVPQDYMHLICLGVTRRLLNLWLCGDLKYRLRPLIQQQISARLENELLSCLPTEFGRKPRSLRYARMWKATEYRQFLFYTGPIALKSKLRPDLYNHFVSLHMAVRIMCCDKLHSLLPYAQQLLEHHVSSFAKLYGRHNVSHNVHGLVHLVEDVAKFGSLDSFSAYKFENYMQTFKRFVRKPNQPLQQIVRRIAEMENNRIVIKASVETEFKVDFKSEHHAGPLVARCSDPQYKFIRRGNVTLKAGNNANCCCGLSYGNIVLIENIAYCLQLQSFVIIGREFFHRDELYKQPCNSSLIGIYAVHTLSELQIWPLQKVVIKYVKFTLGENNFAVFPLLHTDTMNAI
ncbi:uncharacterized protein LOC143894965 [Temnothorax americanus]|uniref:uncharacterized protein LOC143894965 n=1 Tax=Temnothorax americanus TaxID=1964332 RepID=UPI004067D9B0